MGSAWCKEQNTKGKKSKKTQTNGETDHVLGLEDLVLLRCYISPIHYIESMQFQWKNPAGLYIGIDMVALKFIWKGKETRIAKKIWKRITKLEDSHYVIQCYWNAIVINTVVMEKG